MSLRVTFRIERGAAGTSQARPAATSAVPVRALRERRRAYPCRVRPRTVLSLRRVVGGSSAPTSCSVM